jgi:XisI protein
MDKLTRYRQIIKDTLNECAAIPFSYGEIEQRVFIDREENNFFLFNIGWHNKKRIHGCVVHIEIINDKIWIQQDGIEDGIANDFLKAGIPQDEIVLAFHPPSVRPYTEFAVS